jgi:S1/P1 Nuclease
MRNCLRVLLIAALIIVHGSECPVFAWDDTGHRVVARIAWDNMKPQARARSLEILRQADPDTDLNETFLLKDTGSEGKSQAVRDRMFFVRASNWSDIIRNKSSINAERFRKYHHSTWHYINFFWERSASGTPVDRTDLPADAENVVERLQVLSQALSDSTTLAQNKAIFLAWVLHLTGDIHQPLHTSAQVTAVIPGGDEGGNLFPIRSRGGGDTCRKLHCYWDQLLTVKFSAPKQDPQLDKTINDISFMVMSANPRASIEGQLADGQFELWAKEGFAASKTSVYPLSLQPSKKPSVEYRKSAEDIAIPAVALAGYRLADLLNSLFGQ